MGLAALNIVCNMCIVIYYASGDIGSLIKSSYEAWKSKRHLEKRLYTNEMILHGTPLDSVLKQREEYEALNWIREYMPHRHWMLRNNVDMKDIPDEIKYQALETKFKFTIKRKQAMMEYSLVYASKVMMDREEKKT